MAANLEQLIRERDAAFKNLGKISEEIARLQSELQNGLDRRQRAAVTSKLQHLDDRFRHIQNMLYCLELSTS